MPLSPLVLHHKRSYIWQHSALRSTLAAPKGLNPCPALPPTSPLAPSLPPSSAMALAVALPRKFVARFSSHPSSAACFVGSSQRADANLP